MSLADDIRSMVALSSFASGGLPTAVALPSGAIVQAMSGVASIDDSVIHEMVVCGQTRKLTFATADVIGLKTQQNVTWNGKPWGVVQTTLEANGAATVCFLGTAF